MVPHIDIRPDHWDIVEGLLSRHVPDREVWAFGSRAKWTAKTYSDLDLAILGDEPLLPNQLSALQDDFSESSLPWKVDVVEWARLSDSFKQVIKRDHVVVQRRHQERELSRQKWSRLRIRGFAEVFDGPHATPPKTQTGPVFLGITSLVDGRLDLSSTEHVSEEDYVRWTRRVEPMPGDLVFSYETKIGAAALVPEGLRCCLGRRMALIRVDRRRVDPRFLLYQFLGDDFQALLRSRTIPGSTVDRISLKEFPDFEMALPPLLEQQRIARILGTLDDRIELNRRMSLTLEGIAQAIFKSWFVDSKLDDAEAATLKGLTAKIGSGATPRGGSEVYVEEGVALIRSQNVYDSQFVWDGLARITDEAATQLANVQVQPGDVLMNITGASILRTCIVPPNVLPARVNQHVAIIRAKPGVSPHYLHLHLLQPETKAYLLGLNAGGSREAVTKAHIESVPLMDLGAERMNAFHQAVAPLIALAQSLDAENRKLASLRDELLPKLLSGELTPGILEEADAAMIAGAARA